MHRRSVPFIVLIVALSLTVLFARATSTASDSLTLISSARSGGFNVPQHVAFATNKPARVYYTVDGSVPTPKNGTLYREPLVIDRDTLIKAVAVDGQVRSQVLPIRIRLLSAPTSTRPGVMRTLHDRPILQNITRVRFWVPRSPYSSDGSLHFSTLESYQREPSGDKFAIYKYNPKTGALTAHVVPGSTEARWQVYSSKYRKHLLGTSLKPQILLYDAAANTTTPLFAADTTAWMHQIATSGDYVYGVVSAKTTPSHLRGIVRVHIPTKTSTIIPFKDNIQQDWGGAQTIDPTGRLWFYRAYPLSMFWYDARAGIRPRAIPGYDGWTVESWDRWGDSFFVILSSGKGQTIKKQVDLNTLQVTSTSRNVPASFLEAMPLDLYHQGDESVGSLYVNAKTHEFFRADPAARRWEPLGKAILGEQRTPETSATVPASLQNVGEINVLGLVDECGAESSCMPSLVLWVGGQKRYAFLPLGTATPPRLSARDLKSIRAPNLSAADILALAVGPDGRLYGSGYLTISDMFRFDLETHEVTLLEQAIPHGEGEVNGLITGIDGLIYGVGYPDSVVFRYDPRLPWSPGTKPTSNPVHLGRMGHHNQNVSYRGVQDLDGNVWFQSRGEYAFPIRFALAKTNFDSRTMQVKTDVDDKFPIIDDLTVFDATHLLLVGHEGNTFKLYLLDQRAFAIERQFELGRDDGIVINLDPKSGNSDRVYIAKRDVLYRVRQDLGLEAVHKARGEIKKILPGAGGDIILMGLTFVENVNPARGDWEIWWDSEKEPIFRNLPYVPAVFHKGLLYIGDREKLRVLTPPRS